QLASQWYLSRERAGRCPGFFSAPVRGWVCADAYPTTFATARDQISAPSRRTTRTGEALRVYSYPMNHSPAIDVRDLRKTYRDGLLGRTRVEALRGVTFQVGHGEIFGLLGPNGAGKTTLIKVLLGIVRRSYGSASLLGRPPGDR